ALRQLLTHVPDTVITCDHSHSMPNVSHMLGVCMFADISGFTNLCETYGQMGTDSCGTERLTATLNIYIGKIVEDILMNGGDVLKFAGDALLAMWKCENDDPKDLGLLMNKAIICSLAIQEECDNYMTDVGVLLRVKIALSVGKMHITYIGVQDCKHFDLTGPAVEDVNGAEKWATPGSIILTRLAWVNCDQAMFTHEVMEDGHHFKRSLPSPPYSSCPWLESSDGRLQQIGRRGHRGSARLCFQARSLEGEGCLLSYVSKPVLSKIDHGQDLEWLSEMRQVSVLFINMVLPKKGDQSAWAQQKAFEIIYDNVKRLRGNLNKVFSFDKGCTFLVVFGLPGDKHEDDPTRALMAGHRIIDALHTVLEITHEAIGVTTGRAFCGVVGHRDRHEYTVIGRRVNMAARLMVNYPGILSCDNETFTAAKSKLKKDDFLLLPAKPLKGIAEPGPVREYNRNHE
ncbi:predicted protein, partial [Nematostella vectensis]